jgi:hypothetical protein
LSVAAALAPALETLVDTACRRGSDDVTVVAARLSAA